MENRVTDPEEGRSGSQIQDDQSDSVMNWNTHADVTATLDKALRGKLCIQAWLGIAQTLFIGFGDKVLPLTAQGEPHAKPMYELQTGFTDWWIEHKESIVVRSTDARKSAEAGATSLVGRRVVDWSFEGETAALRITFDCGFELRMAPYADYAHSNEDAWILRIPIYYGYMMWDGMIGYGRLDHCFIDEK